MALFGSSPENPMIKESFGISKSRKLVRAVDVEAGVVLYWVKGSEEITSIPIDETDLDTNELIERYS